MGGVTGVVLDDSVLFSAGDGDSNALLSLRPDAESILPLLQFSQLRVAFASEATLSSDKDCGLVGGIFWSARSFIGAEQLSLHIEVNLLARMARLYSVDCFSLNLSSISDAVNEVATAWGDNVGSTLYVVSSDKRNCFDLCNHGWSLVVLDVDGGGGANESSSIYYINRLEGLPLCICRLNRKAVEDEVVIVGYVMKPSRQGDFAKRGAFPMRPTNTGMMFLPLMYELPINVQLRELDVLLHKATDDIMSIELSNSSTVAPSITYTTGMQELRRCLVQQPKCCVIDPFEKIYPVLDRLEMQYILNGLEALNTEARSKIRGPRFLKVDTFDMSDLVEQLYEANLSLPNIVKPQVACGVANSHSMAIVFRNEDYKHLNVPMPAIVQEYVDHSSTMFKFYVLGEKIFYATKKSTPNADILMKLCQANELKPLLFDSLKTLPVSNENHCGDKSLDLELVRSAADWLRRQLELTIFGFDVLIEEGTMDHVIVDLNYLPSFKEVPDDIAIPTFWEAIRNKFEEMRSSK